MGVHKAARNKGPRLALKGMLNGMKVRIMVCGVCVCVFVFVCVLARVCTCENVKNVCTRKRARCEGAETGGEGAETGGEGEGGKVVGSECSSSCKRMSTR